MAINLADSLKFLPLEPPGVGEQQTREAITRSSQTLTRVLGKKKKKERGDVIKKTSKGTMLVFYIAITWFEIHRAQNGIQ